MSVSRSLSDSAADVRRSTKRSGQKALARRDAIYGYLFVAPQTLGFLLFVLGPLVAVFVFSAQDRNLLTDQIRFIGMGNYHRLLTRDMLFGQVLLNSLTFMAGLVPMNLILSLSLALLLAGTTKQAYVFRAVIFTPVVTSAVAWTIIWRFILRGQDGVLNQWLGLLGITGPAWLAEPGWAMFSVIVVRVLKNAGLNTIIFIAALQDLPREFVEAAQIDGATRVQTIRHIVLPHLAPAIMLVSVITIIGSLNVFDTIMLLTEGGPGNATMVLAFYVYHVAFQLYQTGYASALSVVLFIIALGLTLVQWVLRRRFAYSEH